MKTLFILFLTIITFHAYAQEDNLIHPDRVHREIEVGEDKEPEFPGGQIAMQGFINNTIKYPEEALDNEEAGKVWVQFIIEADGSLFDIKVIRGASEALDNEAIRVVKLMPKWIPGESHGKVVRVKYTLPISFRLD
jgi:TonB family protein